MEFPENMFSLWMELPGKLAEQWSKLYKNFSPENLTFGFFKKQDENKSMPFGNLSLYEEWMKMSGETLKKIMDMAPSGGLGPEVFGKVFDGLKSYFALYEFWSQFVKIMAPLRGRTPTTEEWKTVYEKLSQEYRVVLDTVIGRKPPESLEEIMKLQGKMIGQGIEFLSWFKSPWTLLSKQLPNVATKIATGDISAVREGFSLWHTAVTDTIGKLLHIPSLGYSREYEEKQKELTEAYVKFATILPAFYSEFYQAGLKAFDKILEKTKDIPFENNPESFKKFYSIWLQTNEDTFYDLFKREEFTKLMNEVLKKGLDFKKKLDQNISKFLESLSIPNREEMDDVYKTIYEMKKEIRQISKDLQEIKEKINR